MRDRERKLAESIKKIKSEIRKAEKVSHDQMYLSFGNEMEKLFNLDPTCANSKKIAEVCSKYFNSHTTVEASPVVKKSSKSS